MCVVGCVCVGVVRGGCVCEGGEGSWGKEGYEGGDGR